MCIPPSHLVIEDKIFFSILRWAIDFIGLQQVTVIYHIIQSYLMLGRATVHGLSVEHEG